MQLGISRSQKTQRGQLWPLKDKRRDKAMCSRNRAIHNRHKDIHSSRKAIHNNKGMHNSNKAIRNSSNHRLCMQTASLKHPRDPESLNSVLDVDIVYPRARNSRQECGSQVRG